MQNKKTLRRTFNMTTTVESVLEALEKNEVPLGALDWVFKNVKEEASHRVTVKTQLPFQTV